MATKPWTGDIKCAACGHVEATMRLQRGERRFTVLPNPKGKMDLRKRDDGAYALICTRCGHETRYAAEVWRGFL